ncbi:MAG: LON peptidase substrate-binding domain-containing protein [Planctomycetes bacterium]|nr:LON peptidase substrate-binding domain-containing protein [Planctomycetota bacterium]
MSAEASAQAGELIRTVTRELPVLPAQNVVLFPFLKVPVVIAEPHLIELIDDAAATDRAFGFFTIKPEESESSARVPTEGRAYDLYEYGTRAEIMKLAKYPDGTAKIVVGGIERIRLETITQHKPYFRAKVKIAPEDVTRTTEIEALARTVSALFIDIGKQQTYARDEEFQLSIMNITNPLVLVYAIASNLNIAPSEKQKILEANSLKDKLERLVRLLTKELDIVKMGNRIQTEVQSEITKSQREHVLREQMRVIQQGLDEGDDSSQEIVRLKERLNNARLPLEADQVAEQELDRLARMHPSSAEYTVSRTYLDWLIELPWSVATTDDVDIKKAKQILDEDHYGLEKVKERIVEYLAVRKLKEDMKGPILCFVGPPGVGIRGHRRTYVGALPGRILQGIRKAAANNPVFMLDEVDKIGMDFQGDPASALLEVLDPEQNYSFSDHYLEVAFNLAKTMFITTANILDTIPPPLRDRMEVLELPGYTEEEKIEIAKRHLIPKQRLEHGLEQNDAVISDEVLKKIISNYTMEAGVRNLEREIANIFRKVAREKAENIEACRPAKLKEVKPGNLDEFLGVERFFSEVAERTSEPGVATGLAWTPSGGDIIFIESTRMKGNKTLQLTGHLGEVMKESARAALSYIRAKAKSLKINQDFFRDSDIHIHIPAGAIPKDGPSAGLAITVSLISLLLGKAVRPDVAMTGEITLRGKVMPVAGIKTVILPIMNKKDLREIPERMLKGMKFEFVEKIEDSLKYVFRR